MENLSEYITSIEEKITELKEKLEIQNYKKQATRISYGNLMREPEKYEGQVVTFVGEIFQKINDREYLLNTKYDEFLGYYDDKIYLKSKKNYKILEKDIIRIYGTFKGLFSYTTVLGDEVEVPYIEIEVVEFLSRRH